MRSPSSNDLDTAVVLFLLIVGVKTKDIGEAFGSPLAIWAIQRAAMHISSVGAGVSVHAFCEDGEGALD